MDTITNTLRIGNLVWHKEKIIILTNISKYYINIEIGSSNKVVKWIKTEEIRPIFLTKEHFLRFGFKNISEQWKLSEEEPFFVYVKDNKFFGCIRHIHNKFVEIEYVHSLQNLYADIYGIELKWII